MVGTGERCEVRGVRVEEELASSVVTAMIGGRI